jgi:hypothetical protein
MKTYLRVVPSVAGKEKEGAQQKETEGPKKSAKREWG